MYYIDPQYKFGVNLEKTDLVDWRLELAVDI